MPYCSNCEQNTKFIKTSSATVKSCSNCGVFHVTKNNKSIQK